MKKEIKNFNKNILFSMIRRCAILAYHTFEPATMSIVCEDESTVVVFQGLKNSSGYGCKLIYNSVVIDNVYNNITTMSETKTIIKAITEEKGNNKYFLSY